MADKKLVFHHLNNSQSQRILWLLEELGIEYDLQLHERHTSGPKKLRAPDKLKETHPLGKAPQIITPEGRVIVESSAIALYLIDTYDKAGKFKGDPATGNDYIRDEMLTSYGDTSIMSGAGIAMVFDILVKESPFFLRPMVSVIRSAVRSRFLDADFHSKFSHLITELGSQPYFMGQNLGRADFLLSWAFDFCTQKGYIDLAKFPELEAWFDRIHGREAWKSSLQKGNGYDLTSF